MDKETGLPEGASTYSAGTGGSGGSGVVLIRKHKEANA